MTTSRTLLVAATGLFAGAIGFYAGLFVLLAITGLDSPGWSPVAQLTASALFIAAAVSVAAGLSKDRGAALTFALTTVGAVAGLVIMALDLDFEAAIVGALLLVVVATASAHALDRSQIAEQSRPSDSTVSTG